MRVKNTVIVTILLVLVGLNIAAYMNDTDETAAQSTRRVDTPVNAEDLHLLALETEIPNIQGSNRDIFQPIKLSINKQVINKKAKKNTQKTVKNIEKRPTKEEVIKRAIQQEMGRFHYVGSVIKEGKNQAFLLYKGQSYIVQAGKIINGKYRIEAINDSSVIIKETFSGIEKKLPLSDE